MSATRTAPGLAVHEWIALLGPRLFHCSGRCGLHDSRALERSGRRHLSHRCILTVGHAGRCHFIASCGREELAGVGPEPGRNPTPGLWVPSRPRATPTDQARSWGPTVPERFVPESLGPTGKRLSPAPDGPEANRFG